MPTPVSGQVTRIETIDIARGIALLGIFTINLPDMAFPEDLVLYPDPLVQGGAVDYCILLFSETLFAGKMRSLFAVVFGLSASLLVESLARRYERNQVIAIYYKRLLWLGVFGLVNAYLLLWWGDILFQYALLGMALLPLSRASPRILVGLAFACLTLLVLQPVLDHREIRRLEKAYLDVQVLQQGGRPLAPEDSDVVAAWRDAEADRNLDMEYVAEEISARGSDYAAAFIWSLPISLEEQTTLFLKGGAADIFLYMLLGIILLRMGFFGSVHWKRIHVAFVIGVVVLTLIVLAWLNLEYFRHYLDPVRSSFYSIFFDLLRLPLVIGYLLLILIVFAKWKNGYIGHALGATGRMALTNYLTQSIIGLCIFNGSGLAQFNALSRLDLVAIMCSVWAFQIAFSVIWLRFFCNGPFEWLWRSLTYWEAQPLLRERTARR